MLHAVNRCFAVCDLQTVGTRGTQGIRAKLVKGVYDLIFFEQVACRMPAMRRPRNGVRMLHAGPTQEQQAPYDPWPACRSTPWSNDSLY